MLTQEQINDALQKQIDELKKQGENQGKVLSAIGECFGVCTQVRKIIKPIRGKNKMFRFSKKDGTKVQYTVKNVKVGNASDSDYTLFQISARNGAKFEYATVFVWEVLPLKDGDKVEFKEIVSVDVRPYVYKGDSTFQLTFTAKVKILEGKVEAKQIEVEGELVPNFAEREMPF